MFTQGLQSRNTGGSIRQPLYPHTRWAGVCVDSSAELKVVGCNEVFPYLRSAGLRWTLRLFIVQLRFRENLTQSEGVLSIRVLVPGQGFMLLEGHVFSTEVPLFLGLDVLRASGLSRDFRKNFLSSSDPPWRLPMTYTAGHAFISSHALTKGTTTIYRKNKGSRLPQAPEIHYTAGELRHIHLHFPHPRADKMFPLLRPADYAIS